MITLNIMLFLKVALIIVGIILLLPISFYAIAMICAFIWLFIKGSLDTWKELFSWIGGKFRD